VTYHQVTFHGIEHFFKKYSNLITGISDQDNSQLINSYKSLQNYPNPFNPSTRIIFQLSEANHIITNIFDVLGRKIRMLLNSHLNSELHSIVWDASNQITETYFCTIHTKNPKHTIKPDLVR
jgi:hypothetical protein